MILALIQIQNSSNHLNDAVAAERRFSEVVVFITRDGPLWIAAMLLLLHQHYLEVRTCHTNTHKATTCVLHGRHYWLCMSLWVAPISIHVHKKMRVAYSVTLTSFHSSFHVHTELRELPGMLLMFPLFFNMGVMSQWSIECHAFWYKFHIPIYIGFKI